jgi:sugar transferase EpsL
VKHSHRVYDTMKRGLDIIGAAALLIVLSPVLLATAIVVRSALGSPILFRQRRPGRNGELFTIYKFRTMRSRPAAPDGTPSASGDIAAVETDAERLTRAGRLLRASSLDELPELWNVLVGDMSFVGPRPLLVEYLPRYNPVQARRHEVRPGITGWAQVNGRNAVSWPERFAMDVWYVDHRSAWLDIRILGMTFAAVFRREGISSAGHATMEPFAPSDESNPHEESR